MNIKDFLIDNYIWIIVIILITIITIIGFLADKKKSEKPENNMQKNNKNMNSTQPVNNVGQMQYQPQNPLMQIPMNMNNVNPNNNLNNIQMDNNANQMNNVPTNQNFNSVNNQNIMQNETMMAGNIANDINPINNQPQVENIMEAPQPELIYQPLSEQKPVIAPQPIPNISNMQNIQEQPQIIDNGVYQNNNAMNGMMQQPINTQIDMVNNYQQEMPIAQPEKNMPQNINYNMQSIIPQPIENNNFVNNLNNTTIPQPVNVIPMPQPVNAQPIMQNTFNNQQMSQPNYGNQMTPQPEMMNQSIQSIPNQPINFVYGPQNNNQNM